MHRTDVPLLIILLLIGACLALTLCGLDRAVARYDRAMATQAANR
jgi:hypothetical protein